MKTYLFTLSMPNNNAWNGRWSGEGNLYCIVRTYSDKSEAVKNVESKNYHYYNFEDGWGAGVSIAKVDAKTAAKYRKASKGFCGYDWMVNEIETLGRIRTRSERILPKKVDQ